MCTFFVFFLFFGEPHIWANAAWGDKKKKHVPKWDSNKVPYSTFLKKDPEWGNKFHVWRMDWDQEFIRIYLDGELMNEVSLTVTVNGASGDFINPFKQPHYILLDEPLAGIDPIAVGEIRELVSQLKNRGLSVLITDHNVRETLDINDSAYILHGGAVLMEGTPAEIVASEEVRKVYLGDNFSI